MRDIRRQRGLGLLGLLFVLGAIGFVALVVIKVGPLYLNEMTVARAVHGVADEPELASAELPDIRRSLQRRWDVDYIDQVEPKVVRLKRNARGRVLFYEYEARVNLFYNIDVVVRFRNEFAMRNAAANS
jgi:hypothetical protein